MASNARISEAADQVEAFFKNYSGDRSLRSVQVEIAEKCGVKLSSLERRMRRERMPAPGHNGNCRLTEMEEKVVVGFVKGVSAGVHLCLRDLATIGTQVLRFRVPSAPSLTAGWASSFLSRHKGVLAIRALHPSDQMSHVVTICRSFLVWDERIRLKLVSKQFRPEMIFNCDETRVTPRDKTEFGICSTELSNGDLRTIFSVVSAAGFPLFSAYVYRDLRIESDKNKPLIVPDLRRDKTDWPIYFFSSESGFMTSFIWLECMKIFIKLSAALRKTEGEPVLLLADSATMQAKEATADLFSENHADIAFFPSSTSHFLKPLGSIPFAILKNELGSHLRQIKLTEALSPTSTESVNLPHIAFICEKQSMTLQAIQKSFYDRGIYPYDFSKIMAGFNLAHGDTEESYESIDIEDMEQHASENLLMVEAVKFELKPKQVLFFAEDIEAYRLAKEQALADKDKEKAEKAELKAKRDQEKKEKREAVQQKKAVSAATYIEKHSPLPVDPTNENQNPEPKPPSPKKANTTSKRLKPEISCSKCSGKVEDRSTKARCPHCSAFYLCSECLVDDAVLEHIKANHPNVRAPSARRAANR